MKNIKDRKEPSLKTHIRISVTEMAAEQQKSFEMAMDSLLAELGTV